ncbi:LD-carboxypeptidase [Clostridium tarantellae]|uniref:LD-carboxypeptidase N-terminal domain-containing protein n=1 Tax=Clostridium tarantellae TaxID=39493 RepID=A0A6I1MJ35_9CLOT|nr:LD-carboxypeptidase [Clostridium tarantellae]MPQ42152.1 hypothetical protein [Clostridium tarantellae]
MNKKLKFKKGDTIALTACSNSISIDKLYIVNRLKEILNELGFKVEIAKTLYSKDDILNKVQKEKALELINFFKDKNVKAIFDISGGDLANGLLEYIDFNIIKHHFTINLTS